MFGARLQAWGRRMADRIVGPLGSTGITPNSLTLVGFMLNLIAAVILAGGHLVWGGVALLVAGLFDMLDGALARVQRAGSTFGAFFDSTLDRLAEATVGLGLAWHFMGLGPAGRVPLLLVYLMIVGSLMISYARARAEGLGLECKVGLVARPERVVILALGLLLGAAGTVVALGILTLATLGTVGQRIYHVWRISQPDIAAGARRQGAGGAQKAHVAP
ncbi:MAG: CDP-alcohol phosphatidyltransferase family protein [Chloroflexota bacterium]